MSERARISLGRIVLDVARAAGASVLLAMLAAILSSCLVLLPVFLVVSGRAYERIMGLESSQVGRWRLGLAGAPLFLVPLASFFIAASVTRGPELTPASEWAQVLVALVISSVLTVVLFPFSGAPREAIERGTGMLDGCSGSGARAAERGISSTLAHGLAVGALGASPWVVVPLLGPLARGTEQVWLLPVSLAIGAWLALTVSLAITARFWSDGLERFGSDRTLTTTARAASSTPRARLASSLVVALAPLGLLGLLALLALATPTPAWQREERPRHHPLEPVVLRGEPVGSPHAIPGSAGLTLSSPTDDLWLLAAADGGGAGEVRVPHGDETRATLARETFRGVDAWTLRVPTSRDVARVSFDEEGVRLDDTPLDRLASRLGGTLGALAMGLVLLVLVLLALAQVRNLGVATSLDRPRFRGIRELAAFEARLRTTEPVAMTGKALRVSGLAHLDLGPLGSVRLPEGAHPLLVEGSPTSLSDGAVLTVIATLAPAAGSPFRDGTAPLPSDARFVVGTLETAQRAFADRTARVNVLASLPVVALALVLAAVVFVRL